MSVDLPRLKALIDLDSEPFNDGVSKVESRIDQFVARIKNTFSKMESLGKKAGATFAVLAAATGGVMKITSGYEKELKKIEVVSEGNTKIFNKLNKAVEKLEKSKLFSTPDISKAVSSAYAMGKNYEMTADQIINVTNRAKNLSAIYGFGLYDTTTRLMAALRGEAESSEALGLSLSQTAVKAWMLEEGIAGNIETMSLAEQAQIRYKMLMDNTASSIGAASEMAKTLDGGFARLKNTVTDFIKKIGTGFIDKVVEGMNKISDFLDWAGESESLISFIQNLIKLGFIMSGVGIAIGLMGKIGNTVFSLLSISASIVSSPITLIGIAAAVVVTHFDDLAKAWGKFVDKFNQAGSSPEDIKKSFNEMVEGFKSGDLKIALGNAVNVGISSFKFIWEETREILTESNIISYIRKDWDTMISAFKTGDILKGLQAGAQVAVDFSWGVAKIGGKVLEKLSKLTGADIIDQLNAVDTAYMNLKEAIDNKDVLGIITAIGTIGINLVWGTIKVAGRVLINIVEAIRLRVASKIGNPNLGWFEIIAYAAGKVKDVIWSGIQFISKGLDNLANKIRNELGIDKDNDMKFTIADFNILLAGGAKLITSGLNFTNDLSTSITEEIKKIKDALEAVELSKEDKNFVFTEEQEKTLEIYRNLGTSIAEAVGNAFTLAFNLNELIGEAANVAVTALTGNENLGELGEFVSKKIPIYLTAKWALGPFMTASQLSLPFLLAFGKQGLFTGGAMTLTTMWVVEAVTELGAGDKTIEELGDEIAVALAVGIGIGTFLGSPMAGYLAFSIVINVADVVIGPLEDFKNWVADLSSGKLFNKNLDFSEEVRKTAEELEELLTLVSIDPFTEYGNNMHSYYSNVKKELNDVREAMPDLVTVRGLKDSQVKDYYIFLFEYLDKINTLILNSPIEDLKENLKELQNIIPEIASGYTVNSLSGEMTLTYKLDVDDGDAVKKVEDLSKKIDEVVSDEYIATVNITTGITENYDTNLSDTIGTINSSIDLFISKLLDLNDSVNDKVLDIDEVINRLKEKDNISKGQQENIITANNSAIPELTKYIDIPTLLSYYGAESSYGATSNNHFQFNPSTVDDIERITDWLYSLGELTQTYSDIFGSDGFNPTDVTESTKAAQIYLTWLKKSLSQALGYEAPDFVVLSAWNNGLNEVMNFIKTAQSEGENINWLGLLKFRSETETLVTNYNYFHNCMMGIADDARTLDEKINNLGDISITKNIDNFQHQYLYSYDSLLTVKDELNNLNPNYQGFDNTINAIFETGNVIRYGSKVFNNTSDVDNSKPQGAVDEIFDFINYGSDKFIKTPGIDSSKPKENIDAAVEVIEYAYSKFNDLTSMDVSEFNLSLTDPANKTYQATGGYISGPGSGTSDSIPAMLSNGEYVVNAASTSKWLPLLEAINSGSKLPGYKSGGPVLSLPKYSSGGSVDIDTFDTSEFIKPLETALTGFDKTVGNLLSIVAKAATGIIEGLSSILEAMGVDSDTLDVVKGAVSDLQSLIEEIRQDANNALDELKNPKGTPQETGNYYPMGMNTQFYNGEENVWTKAKETIDKIYDYVEEKGSMINSWSDSVTTITNQLTSLDFGGAWESIRNMFSNTKDENGVTGVAEYYKNTKGNIEGFLKSLAPSDLSVDQMAGMNEMISVAGTAGAALATVAVAGLAVFKAFDDLVGLTKALSGAFQSGIKSATSSTLDRISTPFKRLGYLIGRAIVPVLENLEPIIVGIAVVFAHIWNIFASIFGFLGFKKIDIDKLKDPPPGEDPEEMKGVAGNNQPVTNNWNVSFEGNTIIDTDDESMKLMAEKFKQYVLDHGGVEVFFKGV